MAPAFHLRRLRVLSDYFPLVFDAAHWWLNSLHRFFAEFETAIRRERQLEGIAKAKSEGRYNGRPPSFDQGAIRTLLQQGKGVTEITRTLRVGRETVYRVKRATGTLPEQWRS
jgi:DNA invertase Pin-like site-specific DNA recombinase